jgi:type I restriction enzyme, S subunit
VKAGWVVKTLGEVTEVVNGGTPKSNIAEYWGGDVQWLTPKDMGRLSGREVAKTSRMISNLGLRNSSARLVPGRSVILSTRAPIGHLAINAGPMSFNQGCRGLVPKSVLDHVYLYYFLLANKPVLEDLGSGTTFKELSAGNLKSVEIPVPQIEEQHRIVALLDETFEGLDRARENAKANLENAREFFQSFLADEFAEATNGWEISALNDHVRFIDYRGKTPPKSDCGIRLITAKNVKMGYIQREPEEYVIESAYEGWMTRGFPKEGDVLFTTEAPLANVAQLDTNETVIIGQRLITMQPNSDVLRSDFLKFALMSPQMQSEIISRGTGATVVGIKAKLLKTVPLRYPRKLEAQREISLRCQQVYDDMERLRLAFVNKLENLVELRQSLLQKAFAGELT